MLAPSAYAKKRPLATDVADDYSRTDPRRVRFRAEQQGGSLPGGPPAIGGLMGGLGGKFMGAPGSQVEVDEEEEQESSTERVLAFHTPKEGVLAVAYYDPETAVLHVVEDTKDSAEFDLARLVMEQLEPTLVICSSRAADRLIETIDGYCQNMDSALGLQPFKFFTPSHAINQLTLLELPDGTSPRQSQPAQRDATPDAEVTEVEEWAKYGLPEDNGAGMGKRRMAIVKLGAWMNPYAVGAACAAGGLMWYLNKHDPPAEESVNKLSGIEMLTLDQYMLINYDALTSLAILGEESMGGSNWGKPKRGLSLFGLLNECVTPYGKKLLKLWHLRPLMDLCKISARHDAVALFASPEYRFEADELAGNMKKIGNVGTTIRTLRRVRNKLNAFKSVTETLTHTLEVAHGVESLPGPPLEVTEKIRRAVTPEIAHIARVIVETIDWDESRVENRICIRRGVDVDLDTIKDEYAGHGAICTKISRKIYAALPSVTNIATLNVMYFPQICHVIAVSFQDGTEHGLPHDWQRAFMHEDTYYYRNQQMIALNQHYGDIFNIIIDREADHAQALIEKLRPIEPIIVKAVEAIGELDCILALAKAACTYKLVRPKMTEKPILSIRNGRHILQELCVDQYIANDTRIAAGGLEDLCSMMIVTGANGSGKSAYGKQVALITFMAQIGSFVPADSALIGVCDKIYTRLHTKESVSKAASAFMIDLNQISLALRGATERSLIIMDEFGKGTNPTDGAALLAGVVRYLLETTSPRTIVLTHFHELFASQVLGDDLPALFCHMKTMPIPNEERIAYLYRLSPTLSMTSNAAECALAHGIPADIVARARYVTECAMNYELSKLLDTRPSPEEAADLERAEDLARRFLSWDIGSQGEDTMETLKDMLDDVAEQAALRKAEAASNGESGDRGVGSGGHDQHIASDMFGSDAQGGEDEEDTSYTWSTSER